MNLNMQINQDFKEIREWFFSKIEKVISIKKNLQTATEDKNEEMIELLENIKKARNDWHNANLNFESASDVEIIDYYTYKIKACQVRYNYLIKKAKESGINTNNFINTKFTQKNKYDNN